MSDCIFISVSFAMVIFPSFVILPSAIGLIRRSTKTRDSLVYIFPFIASGIILVTAIIYSCVSLLEEPSGANVTLAIIIAFMGLCITIFLPMLGRYLFDLAILKEYEKAKAGNQKPDDQKHNDQKPSESQSDEISGAIT